LPLSELDPYLLPWEAPRGPAPVVPAPAPLDWRAVFGNDRPVEMEVGFGKGLFLLHSAQQRPEINFVGVEIIRKYQLFTATRLALRHLANVRVACADALLFLRDRVGDASLQALHVYFPDPWWKQRHHKRRLFTGEFVEQAVRVLSPTGRLHTVTDVEDYARLIAQTVAEHSPLRAVPAPPPTEPAHDLDYLTNFERKFRKEGRAIWRQSFEKA
jgi:tRNA (guanine-N7-)-methyltransferase